MLIAISALAVGTAMVVLGVTQDQPAVLILGVLLLVIVVVCLHPGWADRVGEGGIGDIGDDDGDGSDA